MRIPSGDLDFLSQSPGHTLRPWRKSLLGELVEPRPILNLRLIGAEVYGGCMDLLQEVVDRIMHTFQDNRKALEVCSLACKAMFASILDPPGPSCYDGEQSVDTRP